MRPISNGRKTRLVSAGAGAVALAIPATAAALTVGPLSTSTGGGNAARSSDVSTVTLRDALAFSPAHARQCEQLLTPRMGDRATPVIYHGTHRVTMANLRTLGYIERCQRNASNPSTRVRTFDRPQPAMHKTRMRAHPPAPAGGWRSPWSCIANYESGGNPAENTGNGFYGGLQFTMSTWVAYGGSGNPAHASISQQEAVAQRVLAAQGWAAWPNTSKMCGL